MINIKNLSKEYKRKNAVLVKALDNVTMDVGNGEIVAVVGQSGSGKSTLLNILGGLDRDYSGDIMVNDKDIREYNPNYYRRYVVGTVFQQFYLVPSLNVEENILLPITFGHQFKHVDAKARLEYLLEMVGLQDRRKHKPNQLSGGQAQRVAIARALIARPHFLLADEPTGNLDSKTGEDILKLMIGLNKEEKITMIIVTHNSDLADKTDRRIKLVDGKNV